MCLTIPNFVPGVLVLMRPCEDSDNQVNLMATDFDFNVCQCAKKEMHLFRNGGESPTVV